MRLLILFVFISFSVKAQYGFFGKKNIVEINTHVNSPVISVLTNLLFGGINEQQFKAKDGKLMEKKNWFNYGFSLQNIHFYKKSTGIGIELAYDFQKTAGPYDLTDNSFSSGNNIVYSINHEMLKINTLTIMPKIEFVSNGSSSLSGLSHQLGLGFALTSIVKKDYLAEYDDFNSSITANHKTILNNIFASKTYKGFSFQYQMNYRIPLSKILFINWGFRYNLNLSALGSSHIFDFLSNNNNNYQDESMRDIKRSINMTRLTNVIQFTLGLGFSY